MLKEIECMAKCGGKTDCLARWAAFVRCLALFAKECELLLLCVQHVFRCPAAAIVANIEKHENQQPKKLATNFRVFCT